MSLQDVVAHLIGVDGIGVALYMGLGLMTLGASVAIVAIVAGSARGVGCGLGSVGVAALSHMILLLWAIHDHAALNHMLLAHGFVLLGSVGVLVVLGNQVHVEGFIVVVVHHGDYAGGSGTAANSTHSDSGCDAAAQVVTLFGNLRSVHRSTRSQCGSLLVDDDVFLCIHNCVVFFVSVAKLPLV